MTSFWGDYLVLFVNSHLLLIIYLAYIKKNTYWLLVYVWKISKGIRYAWFNTYMGLSWGVSMHVIFLIMNSCFIRDESCTNDLSCFLPNISFFYSIFIYSLFENKYKKTTLFFVPYSCTYFCAILWLILIWELLFLTTYLSYAWNPQKYVTNFFFW